MEVESLFPEERGNLQLATFMSMYANAHRDSKRRGTPFEPADFMPGDAHRPSVHPITRDEWLTWKEQLKAGAVPVKLKPKPASAGDKV